MIEITRLDSAQPDFRKRLSRLLDWDQDTDEAIEAAVRGIIADVRERGDAALLEYTRRFDGRQVDEASALELPAGRLEQALEGLAVEQREALTACARRIGNYAEHQKLASWSYTEDDGSVLWQRVTPLDRVGVYVPGGKAAYPSSVLMNAIPARVADVGEVIMVVPAPGGELNEVVLGAAAVAGVDRVFTVGGAQAVAALAYGTQRVPVVDKIVGPGNLYVATAKRLVFGRVGIDMIAGPSEILVVCDGATDPEWVAMDLFSQAEHDEDAQAILVCPDGEYLERVVEAMEGLLPTLERAEIIRVALRNRAALVQVRDLDEAAEVINMVAPEHLELSVADPRLLLEHVRHAGAVFLGRHSAEALGDYCAGPNHVLPTARTARFSSPLGVYDFQKRTSLIQCSPAGADRLGRTASMMARAEGLTAHARSAEFRVLR